MFALPPLGSDAREAFDVEELVRIGLGQFIPPSLPECRALAREAFERYHGAAIQPARLVYFCLRADDQIELISIGPRGGMKREWRFGPLNLNRKGN